MLVCICKALSEREIVAAIEKGSCCLECLEETCGAGTACGACRDGLQEMLRKRPVSGLPGAGARIPDSPSPKPGVGLP